MLLYHGSTCCIEKPDVLHSRGNLDFGRGFYLTSVEAQAKRWAARKAAFVRARESACANGTSASATLSASSMSNAYSHAIVNVYNFSDNLQGLKILEFRETNADWLNFVCDCRRGSKQPNNVGVIVGSVADDKVYEAVNMYFKGLWDAQTTLDALKFYEKNDQYCFVTQTSIDKALKFKHSYEVNYES